MARILIVEDEPTTRRAILAALKKSAHEVVETDNAPAAQALLRERFFHLVITDLVLSAGGTEDGLTVLEHAKTVSPETVVVVLTGQGNVDSAVTAMKRGAADYLQKPSSVAQIRDTVERILREQREALRQRARQTARGGGKAPTQLVGDSPLWSKVMALGERATADGNITVLIRGETGTGKELVARAIHERGPRAPKPFVPVNCVALPDDLLETELFGYLKGAFTGADADKPGLFQLADQGTLFLDEIGDLAERLQGKLLRVLQEREFTPVGALKPIRVNVRVIAATNRNLEERMAQGRFREDLFYRLNVFSLTLPPLRERRDDVPALIDFALDKFNREKQTSTSMGDDVRGVLVNHPWPGNVRELLNLVESLVVLVGTAAVRREHLPERLFASRPEAGTLRAEVKSREKEVVVSALEQNAWNATRAAKALGLTREALQRKMKQMGIKRPVTSDQ